MWGTEWPKKWIGLYKEIIFMNNDIYFLNREWGIQYSLTNFEDYFWIACLSYFLDPNKCGFKHICRVLWSQTPVVNYRTICLYHSTRVDLYSHQILFIQCPYITAPSPCLNQCWLIIKSVLWHSPESHFTSTHELNSLATGRSEQHFR